jgi:hypothetical protein
VRVQFKKERETKNTVVYSEVVDEDKDKEPAIGTLYLRKTAANELADGGPEGLEVEVVPA